MRRAKLTRLTVRSERKSPGQQVHLVRLELPWQVIIESRIVQHFLSTYSVATAAPCVLIA